MKIIIIDNYDSFTFNLFQMLQPLVDEDVEVYRNDQVTFSELVSLKPDRMVMSPGPGHPENELDFGVCKDIVLRRSELRVPTLGVCLGHQGIVHHLGGKVVRAPFIVHGKPSKIAILESSPLFSGMDAEFDAMRYHSLVAEPESVPSELSITAREKQNGLIMALQHKSDPLYGVQFHPESIGTPEGQKMLRNFVELC